MEVGKLATTWKEQKELVDRIRKETYQTAIEDCLKCLPKELSREKHLRNIKEKNIFWCDGHNSCLSLTKENLTKLKSNLKEDKWKKIHLVAVVNLY